MICLRLITRLIICAIFFVAITGCGQSSSFSGNQKDITEVKKVVTTFERLQADALRTGDTSKLSSVARGQLLNYLEDNVSRVFATGQYGKIIRKSDIEFHEIKVDPSRETAKVSYSYTADIQLFWLSSNKCNASIDNAEYGGTYILEKDIGLWYLTVYEDDQSVDELSGWKRNC